MADRAAVTKAKELQALVNKALGADVLKLGNDAHFKVSYIPTGVLPIDRLLDGGIPRGRLTTIIGDYSTLKTYIALCTAAQCQKAGGTVAVIDTEHAYEPEWANSVGVDVDALIVLHPQTAEEAVDFMEAMVRAGVDLLILDSVAAVLPQAEQQKRLHGENIQPGRIAAVMSAALRRLTAANKTNTAFLFINQLRENIGVTFGATTKATGGRAVPYYSSFILELQKVGKINRKVKMYVGENYTEVNEQTGQKYKGQLQKSKLSKPWREVRFDWSLTENRVDELGFMINVGVDAGLIKFNKAKWEYNGLIVNGREKFKAALAKRAQDHPEFLAPLEALCSGDGSLLISDEKPKKVTAKRAPAKKAGKKMLKRRA